MLADFGEGENTEQNKHLLSDWKLGHLSLVRPHDFPKVIPG